MNMAGYWRSSWCSCTSFYKLISACWQNRGNKIQINCCGQHLLKKKAYTQSVSQSQSYGSSPLEEWQIKILAQWGGTGENYTSNIIIIAKQDTSYLIRLHIQTGFSLLFQNVVNCRYSNKKPNINILLIHSVVKSINKIPVVQSH